MSALIIIATTVLLIISLDGYESSIDIRNFSLNVRKDNLKFPKDFSFGVATSAYQIEGAWNADGKGPSIWDEYTHNNPDRIHDRSNGDTAAESYRNFDLDLKILKELKVDHYRFSIAWTRIFPTGDVSSRNQKGIDYYNNVIDKLLSNGIQPMVTMYHWDLPVEIQKLGGFTNSLIIQQFLDYAEELFKLFGDRVKTWITFNEPNMICNAGYGSKINPPLVQSSGIGDYICYTNLLKAHGATYRLYQSNFAEKQHGKIGISIDTIFVYSKSNNTADVSRGMQFLLGTVAHPIYSKTGDFPRIVLEQIENNSREEGRKRSRLPSFGAYWKDVIRGSADFMGVNNYTPRYIERPSNPIGANPSMKRDYDMLTSTDPAWPRAISDWLYSFPQGLEDLLKYIRDEYNNVEVKITENGWSDGGELEDDNRISYIKSHVQAVLNAINDGCNVTSYSVWSLIDNFEWNRGYTECFGLYSVDMKSPKRYRTPKKSAFYYKKMIETKSIPDVSDITFLNSSN